jgi:single-stranded-DNA-specific exonuclease
MSCGARTGTPASSASGRSIPAFDLLGGLDAAAAHLLRHGGHRAAAGCTVARGELEAFRAAFAAHAAAVLAPEELVPVQTVDAVASGDELGLDLADELDRLAPFGTANPDVTVLVPAARLTDARPMGEGGHLRFTVEAGGSRARAVAFSRTALPEAPGGVLDAAFAVERKVRLFTCATSFGSTESLLEHRASVEGAATRAPDNLLRLSIGLEHPDDLVEDLAQALG